MTAVSESFFATLKKELVHLNAWPNLARVRTAVFARRIRTCI